MDATSTPGIYYDEDRHNLSYPKKWIRFSELHCMECNHIGLDRVQYVKVIDRSQKSGYKTKVVVPLTAFCPTCGLLHQWSNKEYGVRSE